MAAKNERAPIDLVAPATPEASGPMVSARFDEATLRVPPDFHNQINVMLPVQIAVQKYSPS
jgi:hypothetical protein